MKYYCSYCFILLVCVLVGCKTPVFNYNHYVNELFVDKVSNKLKKVDEGYYELKVYEKDTIIGGKLYNDFLLYEDGDRMLDYVESVYLYIIDDTRFYYAYKPLTHLELTNAKQKLARLGVYAIMQDSTSFADRRRWARIITSKFSVKLYLSRTSAKHIDKFDYSMIQMHISDDQRTLVFGHAVLGLNTQSKENRLHQKLFSNEQLDLNAYWEFKPYKDGEQLQLTINGQEFDDVKVEKEADGNGQVRYLRKYYQKGNVTAIFTEPLIPQQDVKTW